MDDYQTRLTRQLLAYKADRLPALEDGTWSHGGEPKTYPHILPKEQYRLNILPGIRERFWRWFEAANPPLTRHQFFHHLNSSQALAFNLFFPFLDESTKRVDSRLLQVLGLPATASYTGEFEKVLDRGENTTFDFYLEGPQEPRVFVELKLSESEFGSCADDERHCQKLEKYYCPYLVDHVDSRWLEQKTFFKHYQILRNLSYLGRHPDSGMLFVYPKANESLEESEEAIKKIASRSLAPRIAILYLEALVARIVLAVGDDPVLRGHFLELADKYVVRAAP